MLKNILRNLLNFLHLDLTKNLEYDRLTKLIMKQEINSDSNCIDIGCHKGEILNIMLKLSPNGKHYAFEPIPYLFDNLKNNYNSKAIIYPYALSNENGKTTFQLVKNAPAYSGLKRRKYNIENPDIEEIEVEIKTLDDVIQPETPIHFIKIDVEGGEFNVLKGARNLLIKNKPTIIFEFGLGAGDYYGTTPQELFVFLNSDINLKINTLKSFLRKKKSLTKESFIEAFDSNSEYYFIAYP